MRRWLLRLRIRRRTPRVAESQLFMLGDVLITPEAVRAMQKATVPLNDLLARHQHGDWGLVDEIDRHQNELGVRMGLLIRSAYALPTSPATVIDLCLLGPHPPSPETVWIVTSLDRLRTSVFLAREIFDDYTSQQ